MFLEWTEGSLRKLGYYFSEETHPRKQTLYEQGDPADELLTGVEGEFKFYRTLGDKKHSALDKGVEIYVLSAGELIGDVEIKLGINRLCTCVVTSSHAIVLHVSKEHFLKRITNFRAWEIFKDNVNSKKIWFDKRVK